MNRDTLARKVTLLLHDKARVEGEYKDNQKAAEEAVDDFLSCATLDFLGKGTQPFFNKKDTEDERNRKFCTVPIKLTWKSKGERIRGEQSIRKVCNSKCSVPYPKKIRDLIYEVLKSGQSAKPGCYIRVRVSHETLTVVATPGTVTLGLTLVSQKKSRLIFLNLLSWPIWPTRTIWRISPNSLTPGGAAHGPSPHQGLWAASPLTRSVPHITLSVQNCNSLNISTMCNKQLSKLIAITALCSDIIFLSDLRLNDDIDAIEEISKIFLCNNKRNYYFHHNSNSNSRGVGILIACDFPCKIIYTYKDPDDNILGLVLESSGNIFSICAIYGPNDNNKPFFSSLSNFIKTIGDVPIVIGGDWNATYSQSPAIFNPDIINMSSPPSLIRSGWIADLCSGYGLIDPFRAFHPTRKDFTYFPHGA
jgi:exonuclease III